MSIRYAVIGAGRQGTAAAFDFARFGDAEFILLADSDASRAQCSAERINQLTGCGISHAASVDAGDEIAVTSLLGEYRIDALLCATPYRLNLGLTHAAIAAGVGMTDLGGNSDVVLQQLALSPQASQASISIVPDCGLGPGMTSTLALYAMEQLDQPRQVFIYDCGLPQKPKSPWNYSLTFSIEGLTNEYAGDCLFIREGKTVRVPALEELEHIEFPAPIGMLEAFTTSGGVTSAARSLAGKLQTLQNKTMRYPGHFAQLKTIQQLGLLQLDPIEINGRRVIPRHVLHALWDAQIRAQPGERDLAIIRVLADGIRNGQEMEVQIDLLLVYDEGTDFTAMEQGTGWHAAIITEAIAKGNVPPGVVALEHAMTGADFVAEARKRGFECRMEIRRK
jgi:lysine 6-dehydrogenase